MVTTERLRELATMKLEIPVSAKFQHVLMTALIGELQEVAKELLTYREKRKL